MMKTIKTMFVIVVALLLWQCTSRDLLSAKEELEIKEQIRQRISGYDDALAKQDLQWILDFWGDKEHFVFVADGEVEYDYDKTIREPLKEIFPKFERILFFEYSDDRVTVFNREMATYATKFDYGILLKSGDTIKSKGSWFYLFNKSGDDWKCVQSAGTHKTMEIH